MSCRHFADRGAPACSACAAHARREVGEHAALLARVAELEGLLAAAGTGIDQAWGQATDTADELVAMRAKRDSAIEWGAALLAHVQCAYEVSTRDLMERIVEWARRHRVAVDERYEALVARDQARVKVAELEATLTAVDSITASRIRALPLAPDTHDGKRQRWLRENAARICEGKDPLPYEACGTDKPPPVNADDEVTP
jgi:hypothetical protein